MSLFEVGQKVRCIDHKLSKPQYALKYGKTYVVRKIIRKAEGLALEFDGLPYSVWYYARRFKPLTPRKVILLCT